MDRSLCKLTLVYPPSAEDCVVEFMLSAQPPLTGFTTWKAEGHGHDFSNASVRERVRGRVTRGVLTVVIPRARLRALLDDIRIKAGIPDLTYWVEAVETFGRLAHVEPPTANAGSDKIAA